MTILNEKLKEVALAVLPISFVVFLLHFTLVPLELEMFWRFMLGTLIVILGLAIFLAGAQIGIVAIGTLMGETLMKTNKRYLVAGLGFLLGFLITVAEPDLQILAHQINLASGGLLSSTAILLVVSIGVGVMVSIGLLRILAGQPLNKTFLLVYSFIFLLAIFVSEEFLAISVDASGATTGAMTTPFILALSFGVSQLKGGSKSEEDSFGMVGLASAGPIFAVMLMSLIRGLKNIEAALDPFIFNQGILRPYWQAFPVFFRESFWTILPLVILFILFNRWSFKLSQKTKQHIYFGLIYTFLGLTLFLVGVNAGFMEVGFVIGEKLASHQLSFLLPVIGFVLGLVVVLAEPAVEVLTQQVEEVTAGHIKKQFILVTLSLAIALAVMLAMLRIMIPDLKLWHLLLPGFALAIYLSFHVPAIFVGIAFDSGGVASGPMTATFILAFAQGAAGVIPSANVMVDGFGVIAMVAMMPLIAIQLLGIIYKKKAKQEE